ncbi:hypothetical protein [Chryseobacterium indologenes]|uniref:hypothetical protein n=1 Tax=Chryseobacterium indologenes TaxID=253 RepID=UPI001F4A6760|nr:hypothetical protein [Chryseobacterium indologenes]
MSKLTEIQNMLAKEKGFEDFDLLLEETSEMEIIKCFFNEVSKKYAEECVKASLSKAKEHALIDGSPYSRCGCEVNEESIASNENVVLL